MGKVLSAAAALALAFVPLASARAADPAEVEKLSREAERIGRSVEKIRGLKFSGPVKKGIQGRDELRKFILEELETELPDEKARALEKAYVKIGFLKRGLDLKKTLVDLYTEQIAAFYNPERKELFLVDHGGPEQDMVMAHELTHALQDQNFDLLPLQKGIVDNDDRSLALTSVIEGDATVTMVAFQFGADVSNLPIDIGEAMTFLNQLGEMLGGAGGEKLKSAPKILSENMIFSYMKGASFCQKAARRGGGYDAVSKLFRDPPQSSEQILHPEKYLGKKRDEPVEVTLPDLAAEMGAGWKALTKNVMGEFDTALLFQEELSEGRSKLAAGGWGGDAWQAVEGPGGEVVFAWYTTWDTGADAREFAEAYEAFAKRRGDGARVEVDVRGGRVAVCDGHESEETLEKVRAFFGKATLRTGYAPAGEAVADGNAGAAAAARPENPFLELTLPEGWTAAGSDDPAVKKAWSGPGDVALRVLESPAAAKDAVAAAKQALERIRAVHGAALGNNGVTTDSRGEVGSACIAYTIEGRKSVQWYVVTGGRQFVLALTGPEAAVKEAFAKLRAANRDLLSSKVGARRGTAEKKPPKRDKEPTLF